jgi:hypothetical protein
MKAATAAKVTGGVKIDIETANKIMKNKNKTN